MASPALRYSIGPAIGPAIGPEGVASSGVQGAPLGTGSVQSRGEARGRSRATARALVSPGKGILAADESHPSIGRRFETRWASRTPRRSAARYRQMLLTTPGAAEYVSGVILFDETIRQKADDGTPLVEVLARQGIIPGIKVDRGAKPLAGAPGEQVTEGLDGLRERLAEYAGLGARFAKWRAVIAIGPGLPTDRAIEANAHALARYAALCQEAGVVPIVEPEVLMDGDHTIERCFEATEATLGTVFHALREQGGGARGDAPQAEHGAVGQGMPAPGRHSRGGGGDRRLSPARGPGGGAGHGIPLRRSERGAGHRSPERDERARDVAPVGAQLLLRARAPGLGDPGVAGGSGAGGGRAAGLPPPRSHERRRAARAIHPRPGAHRRVTASPGDGAVGQAPLVKTLAILVGGGPAPGINAVIAAAAIEARNQGLRAVGLLDGYKWLMRGDLSHVQELDINEVSRIHFEGGSILRTSRANPTQSAESLRQVAESLRRLEVSYLVTIGGNDTAFASAQIAAALAGQLSVAHVPKTIDNDLPLPDDVPTFGFVTAVNLGKDLVRNLMQDAATTEKWFFVTVMGRHAGHLTLGIGGAAGATLMLIGEEFPGARVPLGQVADILEGAIIKRRAHGRQHGVALLAEGILEKLDPETVGPVSYDTYGNVRLADLELARSLKDRVSASLAARGIEIGIAAKDLGYELRCAPPGGLRHPVRAKPRLRGDPVPPRRRHRGDGDHPGRATGPGSLPRPARSPDRPRPAPLRGRVVRGLPDALRVHDPPQARGLRAPGPGGGPGRGERARREGVRRPLRLSGRRGARRAANPPEGRPPPSRPNPGASGGRPHVLLIGGQGDRQVPGLDDPGLALPTENADGCGGESEQAAVARRPADPAGGEDPEQVAVAEERDVAARSRAPGR